MIQTRYYQLLSTDSLTSYVRAISSQLIAALGRLAGPPVRLSTIAARFQIDPIPRFGLVEGDGRIDFVREGNKFIITIQGPAPPARINNALFDDFNHSDDLIARQRFTYAHEMAHRFFYVSTEDDGWVRALSVAAADATPGTRNEQLRRLIKREEAACNTIARTVLVPPVLLAELFGGSLSSQPSSMFLVALRRLAKTFRVSEECALIRIQQASDEGTLALRSGFCCFLLSESSRVGAGQRARRGLRLKISLLSVGGQLLRSPFPGIQAHNLGEAFYERVVEAMDQEAPPAVELNIPIQLLRKDGNFQSFNLKGWCTPRPDTYGRSLWIWGDLSCA
jgi:hypothetical protein